MKNKIFDLLNRFLRSKKGRIDTNTELGSMSVLEEVMETFSNVEVGTVFTTKEIKEMVSKVVPTYQPAGEHGSEAKGATYEQQLKTVKE